MRAWFGLVFVFAVLLAGCGTGPVEAPPEADPVKQVSVELAPEPAPPPEEDDEDDGDWTVRRSANPLDDSTTVVALLRSVQGVGGFDSEPILLIARCQSNKTEVYVNWHDYLGDDTNSVYSDQKRVTYRFPPAAAETELWSISTDNDATFVERPIPFLRRLVESERLVMQTTPYGESPTLAIFQLKGARDVIEPISETCDWILDAGDAARVRREREQARREREQARRLEQEREEQARRAEAQEQARRLEQEQEEQARRLEQEQEEQARRLEQEQEARRAEMDSIVASVLGGTPITEGVSIVGREGGREMNDRTYVVLPLGRAYFVRGVDMYDVVDARDGGRYAITCTSGAVQRDEIRLDGCTLAR